MALPTNATEAEAFDRALCERAAAEGAEDVLAPHTYHERLTMLAAHEGRESDELAEQLDAGDEAQPKRGRK